MIKIILSKEIQDKHKIYFKENILPKIIASKNKPFPYDSTKVAKQINVDTTFFKKKIRKQHYHFLGFIKNHYKTLAIGKPSELKNLNDKIQKQFPLVSKILRIKQDKTKQATYSEYLYNLFGYENFKVKDLYSYIKKKAKINIKPKKDIDSIQNEIVNILIFYFPEKRVDINNSLAAEPLSKIDFEKHFKRLEDINITMDNFKQIDIFRDKWSDYAFIMESGIRVCPYCNRQYITPIYSDNGRIRADIDHFLPKSIYPYFSMSLYNLVPVCKSCNQSLKGDKEFGLNSINPYEDNLNDYFKFKTDLVSKKISIDKINGKSKDITNQIEVLKIEALYNYHTNQVEELMRKRIAYPESYIKKLFNDNKNYFTDENELKQLIVGYIEDKSKLNDEAFLKLRRDIAEQLGFISAIQEDDLIQKLKKILETNKI